MESQQNIAFISSLQQLEQPSADDVIMNEIPEEEKVEFDGRIIDGMYQVVRAFDSQKDRNGLFVGLCKNRLDGRLYVIKAMGGSKISMLHKEVASNQHLTKDSRFTVKMISFKLA